MCLSIIFICSAQMLMKSRLAGAQKGHGLLKKKADALQMRFRQILGKIIEVSFSYNRLYCLYIANDKQYLFNFRQKH